VTLHKKERRSAALHQGAAAAPTDTGAVGGSPVAPDPNRPGLAYLEIGEIALNYNHSDPAIFFRLDDDTVAKFSPTAGLKIVNTAANLPAPTATVAPPPDGASFLVRFAADAVTPLGRMATWDSSLPAPATAAPGAPQGDWRWDTGEVFVKAQAADPDWLATGPHAVPLAPGDFQITTEAGAEAIQLWDGTAWVPVFDAQELHRRFAGILRVDRAANLPASSLASPLTANQLAFIEQDAAGGLDPHLAIWRETTAAVGGATPAASVGEWQELRPLYRGSVQRPSDLPTPALGAPLQEGLTFLVRTTQNGDPLNQLQVFHETAPEVPGTTAQQGQWSPIDQTIFAKGTRNDPDPTAGMTHGDLLVTTEADHEQIKVYDSVAGAWHLLYSEDIVKGWIAALSLFQGTVAEDGTTQPGVVAFSDLPYLPSNTQQMAELAAHYYTFVGTPGYHIVGPSPTGGGISTLGSPQPATLTPLPQAGLPYTSPELPLVPSVPGAANGVGGRAVLQIDAAGVITVALRRAGRGYARNDVLTLADPSAPGGLLELTLDVSAAGQSGGDACGLGVDLAGAVLQVGDWLQVVNRGTPQAPDMHWTHIGGDLLAKARADLLYGLQSWAQGTWEAGALVVYNGKVWRAARAITAADGAPGSRLFPFTVAASPSAGLVGVSMGTALARLSGSAAGDWIECTADTNLGSQGPFATTSIQRGDRFVSIGDPVINGVTIDGYTVSRGVIRVPAAAVAAGGTNWVPISPVEIPSSTWTPIDIDAGLKTVADDAALPRVPLPNDLIFVISSARNHNKPSLLMWDVVARDWVVVGGGLPMDLSGGVGLTNIGTPIGSIVAWPSVTIPSGWILCDGRTLNVGQYPQLQAVLGGRQIPDLRGQFIRGHDPRWTTRYLGQQHPWTTGRPRGAPFTGNSNAAGQHNHAAHPTLRWHGLSGGSGSSNLEWGLEWGSGSSIKKDEWTQLDGDHYHTTNISSGGDAETAPDHVTLNYIIKAFETLVTAQP